MVGKGKSWEWEKVEKGKSREGEGWENEGRESEGREGKGKIARETGRLKGKRKLGK